MVYMYPEQKKKAQQPDATDNREWPHRQRSRRLHIPIGSTQSCHSNSRPDWLCRVGVATGCGCDGDEKVEACMESTTPESHHKTPLTLYLCSLYGQLFVVFFDSGVQCMYYF